MRIALVAPVAESVPPLAYGGTERIVALLADGLVERGHQVTLYATGDSSTRAALQATAPIGIRGRVPAGHHGYLEMRQMLLALEDAAHYDVIHGHLGLPATAISRFARIPTTHTLHGAIFPEMLPLLQSLKQLSFVSISDDQRRPCPDLPYAATIHHGLPWQDYPFRSQKDDYLFHLGRICPEKGTHLAIEAALRTRERLVIAAKVDPVDQAYFESQVAPLIDNDRIRYVGEVAHADKVRWLGRAKGVLFPITWEEPFGLVMIEAMGCGTPVIAYRRGSVPELIQDGETGWIVDDLAGMAGAIKRLDRLSPFACRLHVETRFSLARMLDDYEALYRRLSVYAEAA